MRHSLERKEAVLKKMLPPHNRLIRELAGEEGISAATLYVWRKEARAQGRLPGGDQTPADWDSRVKFAAVVETAALNEAELGEYFTFTGRVDRRRIAELLCRADLACARSSKPHSTTYPPCTRPRST